MINLPIMLIVKWAFVGGLGLYSFFAFLIWKQVRVMNEAVRTKGAGVVELLSLVHLGFALLVLGLAIVVN